MQINVYGRPGDGKSFSSVYFLGLPAVAQGRRLLTNIAGVDGKKWSEYLNELLTRQDLSPQEKKLLAFMRESGTDSGSYDFSPLVIPFDLNNVFDEGWVYNPDYPDSSFVQPGDTIIFDEAKQIFGVGKKIPKHYEVFHDMHRHYDTEDGRSITLYYVTQQPMYLSRHITANAQYTFICRRFLSLGKLKEHTFAIDKFEGAATATDIKYESPFDTQQEKFNPRIFKLYKSGNSGGGIESKTTPTPTLWDIKYFGLSLYKVWLPVLVCFLFLMLYFVYSSVQGIANQKPKAKLEPAATSQTTSAPTPAAPGPQKKVDSGLRLVGFYTINTVSYALVSDDSGNLQYVKDFTYEDLNLGTSIKVDGKTVSYWTGSNRPQQTKSDGVSNEKNNSFISYSGK